MDQDLARLRRAVETDPADEAAARAYDDALRRSGRTADVEERFRFKFRCPVDWYSLKAGSAPGTRFCGKCEREVHFVSSAAAMLEHMAAGRCVAFSTSSANEHFARMVASEVLTSAKAPGSPCALEVKAPPLPPPPVLTGMPVAVQRPLSRREPPPVAPPPGLASPPPAPKGLLARVRRLFGATPPGSA